jgi:hypothetical protein
LKDLCYVIKNEHIIKQGSILNGSTKIDADNYYVQTGDMRNIELMFTEVADIKFKEIDEQGDKETYKLKIK